jgi:arylsulfatase A-like enzyme
VHRCFLVIALSLVACGRAVAPAPRVDDLSVVLVVLDAAGARYFGTYGGTRPTSPHFDAFAAEATVFERAYAQAAWTLPSTASLLTGRYPPRFGQAHMRVEAPTLATILRGAGFRTAAFSGNPYVTAEFGFGAGFDVFREYSPYALLVQNPRTFRSDSERLTNDGVEWTRVEPDARTFLYVHLLLPHSPYHPPAPFRGRFAAPGETTIEPTTDTLLGIDEGRIPASPRDIEYLRTRYEENLAYGDHLLGRLLDALQADGRLERTIVVVTSDHGEAFREHGRMLHTTTLYEEMIHVPLVIRFPSRFGRLPARWGGVVELRDLVPTLCDALRIACGIDAARSLLARLRAGASSGRVARAWTNWPGSTDVGAIVTDGPKLVRDARARRTALYDIGTDPDEEHDVAARRPQLKRRLARSLRGAHAPRGTNRAVSEPETRDKLRALGYVE